MFCETRCERSACTTRGTGVRRSAFILLLLLPALLPAQTNTFPSTGNVGIGLTGSPQYPLDVAGAIHTTGTLVLGSGQTLGQSVTFTPAATTTGEWYRILTGPNSLGGVVRINGWMDNTYSDVEVQFNVGGYGNDPQAASIVETRFSSYNGGNVMAVDQVRACSDGGGNAYFDIHISHAWTPAPITVSVDGPDILPPSTSYSWGLVSSPALVTAAPAGTNATLTLGQGVLSTAGARFGGNIVSTAGATFGGNMSVGTTSTAYANLRVNKLLRLDDDSASPTGSNTLGAAPNLYIGTEGGGNSFQYNAGGGLDLWQNNPTNGWFQSVTFAKTGSVGIGTTTPVHKLQVSGTIGAEEIIVSSTGADYVFDPGYKLQPLQDVAAYVSANHHLPDIPSAQEMKDSGVSLGEIQTKLLAKIEELTLHLIQEKQRNDRLEDVNDSLLKRVETIEKAIAK